MLGSVHQYVNHFLILEFSVQVNHSCSQTLTGTHRQHSPHSPSLTPHSLTASGAVVDFLNCHSPTTSQMDGWTNILQAQSTSSSLLLLLFFFVVFALLLLAPFLASSRTTSWVEFLPPGPSLCWWWMCALFTLCCCQQTPATAVESRVVWCCQAERNTQNDHSGTALARGQNAERASISQQTGRASFWNRSIAQILGLGGCSFQTIIFLQTYISPPNHVSICSCAKLNPLSIFVLKSVFSCCLALACLQSPAQNVVHPFDRPGAASVRHGDVHEHSD